MTRLLPILLLWCVTARGQVMLPHRHAIVTAKPDPIFADLLDYWRLDESSNIWYDVVGTNHLYLSSYYAKAVLITNSFECIAGITNHLEATDSPELSAGDIDFSVSLWVYRTAQTEGVPQLVIAKGDGHTLNAANYEWLIQISQNSGDNIPQFYVSNSSAFSSYATGAGGTGDLIPVGAWKHIVAWHDHTANQIRLYINGTGGTAVSYSNGSWDSTQPFLIGGGYYRQPSAVIDEVGFWKKKLSDAEITALYNSGSGLTYPFTGTPSLVTNLSAYWRLDEGWGTRADVAGTNSAYLVCVLPTPPAGVVTNCWDFSDGTTLFRAPDSDSMAGGDFDFTVTGWFKLKNWTTNNAERLMLKGSTRTNEYSTASGHEWFFDAGSTNGAAPRQPEFGVSNGTTRQVVYATNLLSTNTWYFVVGRHDSTNNTISMQLNDGYVSSTNWSGGSWNSTWPLYVGGGSGSEMVGYVDEIAYWKRLLTTNESNRVYSNTLAGHSYPFW